MREHTTDPNDDIFDRYAQYTDSDDDAPRAQRMRRRRSDDEIGPQRRGRLTAEERDLLALRREDAVTEDGILPPDGDRWSTWDDGDQGPRPHPQWLITELAAVDRELGVLKTGKEADVHLLERFMPGTPRSCLLAAKRYRSNDHRLFHRDTGYLEGRRMRRSREGRAIALRSDFGRNLIAEQWAAAEFAALGRLWELGAPVPYPAQRVGTELLLEFIGSAEGGAAPRLAQLRPDPDQLRDLWDQLLAAMLLLARNGYAHGDLSAYNLLVHEDRLVLIDLPQVVDVVANPRGMEFLERDFQNVSAWFAARGLGVAELDPETWVRALRAEAGLDA
ncbi:RIO kinase 1 [Streptoalloteichus hindustanus]|uniref:non-specific serine/threonine protein kinase n=2 Tax=Streptoalloteichus hindustanus TaxID=2017 RepID=A0A1M5B234_STRHI|nr:RIO kinase 1 [Streptoalloteichus hindustanus]